MQVADKLVDELATFLRKIKLHGFSLGLRLDLVDLRKHRSHNDYQHEDADHYFDQRESCLISLSAIPGMLHLSSLSALAELQVRRRSGSDFAVRFPLQ